MKALSIRQPWAELILQGRKIIELRTWHTNYRGRIAIHAGKTIKEAACAAYGLDPDTLVRGALVGTVEIVDMVPLDDEQWEALRDQHLSLGAYPGDPSTGSGRGLLGWRLANPQRLPAPIPMRGRQGLFNIPDDLVGQTFQSAAIEQAGKPRAERRPRAAPRARRRPTPADLYRVGAEAGYDPEKPFELRVVPRDGGNYGLVIYQWPVEANAASGTTPLPPAGGQPPERGAGGPQRLVELAGDPLRAVADHVLEALRTAGYRATDLSRERRKPFRLEEEAGLRLGLLFLAVKPLTRMDRIEAISSALRTMPSEEAYYWFSKCTAGAGAVNARRALRILLAGE